MIFSGCQSKAKEVTIEERICPQCGNVIEIFSVYTEVVWENGEFHILSENVVYYKDKVEPWAK